MPSLSKPHRIIVSAAGSGKTTHLVRHAIANPNKKIAIITYTNENEKEIRSKFFQENGKVPGHVDILTWFAFLLRECVRPYQNYVYKEKRISNILFVEGKSASYIPKTNVRSYYFSDGEHIYTDKISEFVGLCEQKSGGKVFCRLASIYDEILIDEVQDLAGYDLELIENLLKNSFDLTIRLVGDPRQTTYSTNNSPKNKKFKGNGVIEKFLKWQSSKLCTVDQSTLNKSHRCNQAICDFADSLYPDYQKTESGNITQTGHDGLFVVRENQLEEYVRLFEPKFLRYSKATLCNWPASNFGQTKGLDFDRVLILPTKKIEKVLAGKGNELENTSLAKFYVAITRARHSVAFLYDGNVGIDEVMVYSNNL